MKTFDLINKFQNIVVWKKGNQRAPHKPLLLLYALSQVGENRYISYKIVHERISYLLKEFGPQRKSYHPEHPFVRLKNDGIWELNTSIVKNEFSSKLLLANNVLGGFTEEIYQLLLNNPKLIEDLAHIILIQHFPETFHQDILNAIGIDFTPILGLKNKRHRDRAFREKVLKAYGYSCAVCNFNVRLSEQLVGIEAAHIKWHHAGGPDNESNGVALCSLHHKLFDRGVFTISQTGHLIVSEYAHGSQGFNDWLLKYHNIEINKPIHPSYIANPTFLNWHYQEVFRGPGRFVYK